MSAARLAVLASAAAVAIWALKGVAIGVAGGLDKSPFEGPLFVLGLVAIVVAVAALGVAVAGARPVAIKVGAAVLGVVVGVGIALVSDSVAGMVVSDSAGWVQEEAGLWFAALLVLGVTLLWYRRSAAR